MPATLATPASNAIVNYSDQRPLSAWWPRTMVIVMVIGFTVLIAIALMVFVLRQASDEARWASKDTSRPLFSGPTLAWR